MSQFHGRDEEHQAAALVYADERTRAARGSDDKDLMHTHDITN